MNFVPDTEVMENGTRYSPDSMSGHIITFLKLFTFPLPLKVSKFSRIKNIKKGVEGSLTITFD